MSLQSVTFFQRFFPHFPFSIEMLKKNKITMSENKLNRNHIMTNRKEQKINRWGEKKTESRKMERVISIQVVKMTLQHFTRNYNHHFVHYILHIFIYLFSCFCSSNRLIIFISTFMNKLNSM